MRTFPRGLTARGAIDRLQIAFRSGDVSALVNAYEQAVRDPRLLGLAIRLLEHHYPLGAFLKLASTLDRRIAEDGLHEGCRRFLNDVPVEWERVLPPACEAIARSQPVIFYGNHPSLLTPFLVAASVDRCDLRYFSTSYVCHLIPSFGNVSYPMEVPLTRAWTEWRRGGWKRVLAHRLASLVHEVPEPEEARRINRRSLESGADHVRRGGSAMICPGGGGTRDRYWFPGIGSLVKQLQERPGDGDAYLIAVHEEKCTNRSIYAWLLHKPAADRLRVRIVFADPIPVHAVAPPASTVEQIAELLRVQYESLFAKAALSPH